MMYEDKVDTKKMSLVEYNWIAIFVQNHIDLQQWFTKFFLKSNALS